MSLSIAVFNVEWHLPMHPKDTTSFLITWFMTEIIYTIKRWFSKSRLTQAGTKSNNASNEGKRQRSILRVHNKHGKAAIISLLSPRVKTKNQKSYTSSVETSLGHPTTLDNSPPPLFFLSSPPCSVDVDC